MEITTDKPVFGPVQTEDIFVNKWKLRLHALNMRKSDPTDMVPRSTWELDAFDMVMAFKNDLGHTGLVFPAAPPSLPPQPGLESLFAEIYTLQTLINLTVYLVTSSYPKRLKDPVSKKNTNELMDKVMAAEIDGTWAAVSEKGEKDMKALCESVLADDNDRGPQTSCSPNPWIY